MIESRPAQNGSYDATGPLLKDLKIDLFFVVYLFFKLNYMESN